MKKLVLVVVVVMLMAGQAWCESLCTSDEKSMFSCKLGNSIKSVSICQSKSNPKNIYYKFGTSQKIEVTLPTEKSKKPYLVYEKFGRPHNGCKVLISHPEKSFIALPHRKEFL